MLLAFNYLNKCTRLLPITCVSNQDDKISTWITCITTYCTIQYLSYSFRFTLPAIVCLLGAYYIALVKYIYIYNCK